MGRFSLRTILFCFAVVALLLSSFRDPINRAIRINSDKYPLKPVATEKELEAMLDQPRAIVFINADWSMDSAVAKRSVVEFARDWRWFRREPNVSFYVIDITDSNPDLDFDKWTETDSRLWHVRGGCGSVIWLRNGSVEHVFEPNMRTTQFTLRQKTVSSFCVE